MSEPIYNETITFWEPRYQRKLSAEDGRQIVENIRGYFGILGEWNQAEGAASSSITPADGKKGGAHEINTPARRQFGEHSHATERLALQEVA